jgi:hypothetical protein
MVNVMRVSPLTGKTNIMKLDISLDQIRQWENGLGLIQDIMPNLTASEREFIMTGMTDDDWDEAFGE